MAKTLVFTPIPFALNEVPLGSLVTDILRPHRSVEVIKPAHPDDSKSSDQDGFDGVLKSEVASGFFAQLTRLLHLSRDKSRNVSLHVTAEQGKENWLKNPEKFWEDMLTKDETKGAASTFLSGVYKQGDAWFVTATRTFVDSTVEVENGKGTEWKIDAEVPAGKIALAAAGIPAGDIGDAGDIGGGWTRTRTGGGIERFMVSGERIFSIEFRKVVIEKYEQGVSGEVPKDKTVIKTLPDFRGGQDTGGDMVVEESYLVGLDSRGDTLEDYNDELDELEGSGQVGIIRDEEGNAVYIDPKWVEYEEPEQLPGRSRSSNT
ncbi:hypothetical protein B0H67DRAFT_572402 [Lasiosphaeris hirsuta]|uniref:Uncharacterized protein n=1 Tax=Lasiosphaeris hirsuta TaxID=260670 RepID=A0AA40E307_9PEZI|nr:hypothetical protein B0H67DRAFT_572402 [Lasiosphaeris hirsuta]